MVEILVTVQSDRLWQIVRFSTHAYLHAMVILKAKRIALLSTLLVVGLMIWGLYELTHLPYRPPHDMSTLLGKPELQIVWSLITLLAIAWVGFFIWFVFTFVPENDDV